MTTLWYFT